EISTGVRAMKDAAPSGVQAPAVLDRANRKRRILHDYRARRAALTEQQGSPRSTRKFSIGAPILQRYAGIGHASQNRFAHERLMDLHAESLPSVSPPPRSSGIPVQRAAA